MPDEYPNNGFTVTLKDVYDVVQEMKVAVTGIPERVTKLEDKVEKLSSRVYVMAGAAGVTGTIVGAILGNRV